MRAKIEFPASKVNRNKIIYREKHETIDVVRVRVPEFDKRNNDFDEYKNDVSYIKERRDVWWGGYSQIESMLVLLNEARKKIIII